MPPVGCSYSREMDAGSIDVVPLDLGGVVIRFAPREELLARAVRNGFDPAPAFALWRGSLDGDGDDPSPLVRLERGE